MAAVHRLIERLISVPQADGAVALYVTERNNGSNSYDVSGARRGYRATVSCEPMLLS